MLGLRQQIDRHDKGVGGLVGDDEDLGGTGEQVDADLAEQLALCLGHIGIARSGDQIDPLDRLGSGGQGPDRLNSTEKVDLVRAREVHRCYGRGWDLTTDRRGACGDAGHPGDLAVTMVMCADAVSGYRPPGT